MMRGFEKNGLELEIYGHGGCEKKSQIMKLHSDGCTVVPKDVSYRHLLIYPSGDETNSMF